jgi:hypothetical protein
VVLYDKEAFHTAGYTDADLQLTTPQSYPNSNEEREEAWLDANATPLLVNRFNGTLSKGG